MPHQIRSQIHRFLGYKKDERRPVQISFFGGNFLGLKIDDIRLLLDLAAEFVRQGYAGSIRFSTRPDTITPERIDFVSDYPVETVELGVQSMEDHVLGLTRRGHTAADTTRAVHQLKEHGFNVGLQMMVGLPGDNEVLSLNTAAKIAALQPDFVRIYPTLVVKNSQLASWYKDGRYSPLSLQEAVTRVKKLHRLFGREDIKVIRMGLQASADLEDGSTVLAGPYHAAFGHLVYSEIFYDAATAALDAAKTVSKTIIISVNPRSVSKMRGLNNMNIKKLKKRYQFESVAVVPDSSLARDELLVG